MHVVKLIINNNNDDPVFDLIARLRGSTLAVSQTLSVKQLSIHERKRLTVDIHEFSFIHEFSLIAFFLVTEV
jgi:hypothetical protein